MIVDRLHHPSGTQQVLPRRVDTKALTEARVLRREYVDSSDDRLHHMRELWPSELIDLARRDSVTILRNGKNEISWLPLAQVFQVEDIRTGNELLVSREAVTTRRESLDDGRTAQKALMQDIARIRRDPYGRTSIDPDKDNWLARLFRVRSIRTVNQVAPEIAEAVGRPLALKTIPRPRFINHLEERGSIAQFLRMRMLDLIAEQRLPDDLATSLAFPHVYAAFRENLSNGSPGDQWLLMDLVEGKRLLDPDEPGDPPRYPEFSEIFKGADPAETLRSYGLPLIDLHPRNVIHHTDPTWGKTKYTIIDQ